MNDLTLLTFGCAITFLSAAGAYVALRERYLHGLARRLAERRLPARQERSPSALRQAARS